MPESGPLGIYISVGVEPAGKNRKFFDQFRGMNTQEVIDSLHVSCQYPEEVAAFDLSTDEQTRVYDANHEIAGRLKELNIIGHTVSISPERGIQGKKKWWTVEIHEDDQDLFRNVRAVGAEVVQDRLGVKIASYSPDGYHISFARRQNIGHNSIKVKTQPPLDWVIKSIGSGVSVARKYTDRPYSQRYANDSRRGDRRKNQRY